MDSVYGAHSVLLSMYGQWRQLICGILALSPERCLTLNLDVLDSRAIISVVFISTSFILVTLLLFIVLNAVIGRVLTWLATLDGGKGSKAVGIATDTLQQLRVSTPEYHPPTKHAWYGAQDVDISSPLLCCVCVGAIPPLAPGGQLQCCSCCGLVAHDKCVRHVGDTCRPISTPGGSPQHFWLAAGTTKEDAEGEHATDDDSTVCLYCGESGTVGVFAEPTWRCACCNAMAHVGCFCESHPQLPQLKAQFEKIATEATKAPQLPWSPIKHNNIHNTAAADAARAAGAAAARAAGGSPVTERHKVLQRSRIEKLDACSLGPMRHIILPSSCVSPITSEHSNTSTHNNNSHHDTNTKHRHSTATTATIAPLKQQHAPSTKRRNGKKSNNSSSSGKKGSWWRRLLGPAPPRWGDYRISDRLPLGIKPVLVFINLNSGPRLGKDLYRQFLRLLHPLQVIALPREKPDPALRMFMHVPGLRILAIGGDGTVNWIMNCIEAEIAAAGGPGGKLKPPPVAILPFGTGNDLARCLGWGGGWRSWGKAVSSPALILKEVVAATPVLVDRWEVITTLGKESKEETATAIASGSGAAGMQTRSSTARHMLASSPGSNRSSGKNVQPMNNYLGVGIDAKVSLDFHQMREAHPHWFSSQVGNKLGYTVLGAHGIVKREVLNLGQKVEVLCDGEVVQLPPGAEGLLLLNIHSWMGGVDVWATGIDQSPAPLEPQSMFDGRIEIVAVFGAFHLGQLQVGLARGMKLAQGRNVTLRVLAPVPMHIDGEPFVQGPSSISVQQHGQGLLLKRVESQTVARVLQAVAEALEAAEESGNISAPQHEALTRQLTAKLQPYL